MERLPIEGTFKDSQEGGWWGARIVHPGEAKLLVLQLSTLLSWMVIGTQKDRWVPCDNTEPSELTRYSMNQQVSYVREIVLSEQPSSLVTEKEACSPS